MQIYFHSRLCSYLSRVPILVEGTVYHIFKMFQQKYIQEKTHSTLYISACPSLINLHVDKIIIEKLYNNIN